MKNFIFIISFIFLISCEEVDITQNTSRGLVINEFLASNDACCPDDYNDYDDWSLPTAGQLQKHILANWGNLFVENFSTEAAAPGGHHRGWRP